MRWLSLVVRVLRTIGLTAGTEQSIQVVPWRTTCDLMDCSPSLFTGERDLAKLGWDCSRVTLRQTLPLPSTILSISGKVEINDG